MFTPQRENWFPSDLWQSIGLLHSLGDHRSFQLLDFEKLSRHGQNLLRVSLNYFLTCLHPIQISYFTVSTIVFTIDFFAKNTQIRFHRWLEYLKRDLFPRWVESNGVHSFPSTGSRPTLKEPGWTYGSRTQGWCFVMNSLPLPNQKRMILHREKGENP